MRKVQTVRSNPATLPGRLTEVALDNPVPPPANVRITPTLTRLPSPYDIVRGIRVDWDVIEGATYSVAFSGPGEETTLISMPPCLLPIYGNRPGPYLLSVTTKVGNLSSTPFRIDICSTGLPEPTGLNGHWATSDALWFNCSWDPVPGADHYWVGFEGGGGESITQFRPTPTGSYRWTNGDDPPDSFWVQAIASQGIIVSPIARHSGIRPVPMPTGLDARYAEGCLELFWSPVPGAELYRVGIRHDLVQHFHDVREPRLDFAPVGAGVFQFTVQAIPSDGSGITSIQAERQLALPVPPSVRITASDWLTDTGIRTLWISVDGPLDGSYAMSFGVAGQPPVKRWRTDRLSAQPFTLPLPADLPDGPYQLSVSNLVRGTPGDPTRVEIGELPAPTGFWENWYFDDNAYPSDYLHWDMGCQPVPGANAYWFEIVTPGFGTVLTKVTPWLGLDGNKNDIPVGGQRWSSRSNVKDVGIPTRVSMQAIRDDGSGPFALSRVVGFDVNFPSRIAKRIL